MALVLKKRLVSVQKTKKDASDVGEQKKKKILLVLKNVCLCVRELVHVFATRACVIRVRVLMTGTHKQTSYTPSLCGSVGKEGAV